MLTLNGTGTQCNTDTVGGRDEGCPEECGNEEKGMAHAEDESEGAGGGFFLTAIDRSISRVKVTSSRLECLSSAPVLSIPMRNLKSASSGRPCRSAFVRFALRTFCFKLPSR